MQFIQPDEQVLKALVETYPADVPVVMLNLLKFREQADYPAVAEQQPCTGGEAFARYGQAVTPMIEACGGKQIWQGQQAAMLIGPQDKQWHLAVLVEYPSVRAFLNMVSTPEYRDIAVHRSAALEDSRLIAHRQL